MATGAAEALVSLICGEAHASGTQLPAVSDVACAAEELRGRLGGVDVLTADPEATEAPNVFLTWLLRMAVRTYRREVEAQMDAPAELCARFDALLAARPGRNADHAQLHIDAASSLRRAAVMARRMAGQSGRWLFVGDDDATVLAAVLLGQRDVAVIDIDGELLEFLVSAAASLGVSLDAERVDFFAQPLPSRFVASCVAASTDPIRSAEGVLVFLNHARASLRPGAGSMVALSDHPDWNFEHDQVLAALPALGLTVVDEHHDLQRYPLTRDAFPQLDDMATALGVDPAWIARLTEATAAWSHLFILQSTRR